MKTSRIIFSGDVLFDKSSRGIDSQQEATQSCQFEIIDEPEGEHESRNQKESLNQISQLIQNQ